MQRPIHERILWQAAPFQSRGTGFMSLFALMIQIMIYINAEDTSRFGLDFYIGFFTFTLMSIILLSTKLTITTQRIFVSNLFLRSEYHRPTEDTNLTLQRIDNFNIIESYRKSTQKSFHDFWLYRAVLTFPKPQTSYTFSKIQPLKQYNFSFLSKKQVDEIIPILKHHWQLDTEIHTVTISKLEQQRQEEDIGKTAVILVILSIMIGMVALIMPPFFFNGLHFAVEPNLPIIFFILIAIILSYRIIRLEKKKYPELAAILCGTALGASLFFMALQLNRFYNEKSAQTIPVMMTLTAVEKHSQIWTLNPDFAKQIQIDTIYIHKNWQGYINPSYG